MKALCTILLMTTLALATFNCSSQKRAAAPPKELYKSESLVVLQITDNTFQHISYKQTNDFGNVPCNGLIVRNGSEVVVFDTPTNDNSATELINWIQQKLRCTINAVIPTHFHDDCLGGLKAFDDAKIPSYGHSKTIRLAQENKYLAPRNGFEDSLVLTVGTAHITAKFFGEGHTKDNVVGYFPRENVMFGGCLVKTLKASKGYVGDANLDEWSNTVAKVKKAYPNVKVVVPGHGDCGNGQLLDYTIDLFKK